MEAVIHRALYYKVAAALLGLLVLTVAIAFVDLGVFNLPAALGIAAAKAVLVILFFMEVRFSRPATKVMAAAGVLWLFLLIGGTLADVITRVSVVLPGP